MKRSKIWYILGLLLLSTAIIITGYYLYENYSASKNIQVISEKLSVSIASSVSVDSDADAANTTTQVLPATLTSPTLSGLPLYIQYPDMDMPTIEIDGWSYIGLLEISSINLSLPVMENWSYEQLEISPCRYAGSVYTHDIVICGHNYRSHFSPIKWLEAGTEATFTDVDGNVFTYILSYTETISPDDTSAMVATDGSWDMTLFTCNTGGGSRKALRFKLISESE